VGENVLEFTDWCGKMRAEQPQFKYWAVVLEMELNIFQIIESIRTGHFLSYRESLSMFIPWVFSFDHINYARWLSVHIRDMFSLSETHPVIYKGCVAGRFVASVLQNKPSNLCHGTWSSPRTGKCQCER